MYKRVCNFLQDSPKLLLLSYQKKIVKEGTNKKNPAYGRHQISRPIRIEALILFDRPGVAGAVLQTASSLIESVILFLQIFITS